MSEAQESDRDQPGQSEEDVSPPSGSDPQGESATRALNPPFTYWAIVADNGTLIRGFGAVSARKVNFGSGLGRYEVVFDRAVTNAAYFVTIGRWSGTDPTVPAGTATVNLMGGTTNGVFVVTRDESWVRQDRSFHLAVHF
jgi:hypothetical protein